jgi:hypothetical protein
MDRQMRSLGGAVALVVVTGCWGGAGVETSPGGVDTRGITTVAGVQIEARFDDWDGKPKHLDRTLTPVLVRIDNNGDRPMMVRFAKLALTDGSRRYTVVPPFDVTRPITMEYTVARPYFPNWDFAVAPYLLRFYPGATPAAGKFEFDPAPYAAQARFQNSKLPTADMVQRALPEGIVAPHGHVGGFVYFELAPVDRARLKFVAELVDPESQEVATATIPFVNGG